MDLEQMAPLVVYDDQCYLCSKFAQMVNALGRGKFTMVGHYSKIGQKLRDEVLDSSALEMFWFIDKKTAYGGRAALYPLLKTMIFAKTKHRGLPNTSQVCQTECKNIKAVFIRSVSLLTNSKTIKIK